MADTKRNPDYVPHGGPQHAAMIGLRKATDKDELQLEGWTLVDMTAFGPQASEMYIREVLRQKVSTLKAGSPPVPQSEDPRKPNYAPPIWVPGGNNTTTG